MSGQKNEMNGGKKVCSRGNELQVITSPAGFYIGTLEYDADLGINVPQCRLSDCYWAERDKAQHALDTMVFPDRVAPEIQFCNMGRGCISDEGTDTE